MNQKRQQYYVAIRMTLKIISFRDLYERADKSKFTLWKSWF